MPITHCSRRRIKPAAERCLLAVNRVIFTMGRSLPVFPKKQTFSGCVGMSQRCHKWTSHSQFGMKEAAG